MSPRETPGPLLELPTASASSPVTPIVAPAGAADVAAARIRVGLQLGRRRRIEAIEQQRIRRPPVGCTKCLVAGVGLVEHPDVRHGLFDGTEDLRDRRSVPETCCPAGKVTETR